MKIFENIVNVACIGDKMIWHIPLASIQGFGLTVVLFDCANNSKVCVDVNVYTLRFYDMVRYRTLRGIVSAWCACVDVFMYTLIM